MISRLFEMFARLRALFLRSELDQELDEELNTHVELLTEESIQRGIPPDAARRAALLKVGNLGAAKEVHRDTRSVRIIEDFLRDARQSVRLLRRNPFFTLLASLSLAIGIGADATVFTAANALLFRSPAAVHEPDRLVEISRTERGKFGVFEISYPDFLDIARRSSTLEDVYMYEGMGATTPMLTPAGAEAVFRTTVSLNYFQVLGVGSAAGQLFPTNAGLESHNNPYVVLSYAFWQRRFNGDLSVIGKTVRINDTDLQVVGVAANGFHGTSIVAPDIWVPIGSTPMDVPRSTRRDVGSGLIGGRLKRGVTVGQANAELDAIGRALAAEYPNEHPNAGLRVTRSSMIPANLVLPIMGIFSLLMAFVSLVLLIACANMAGVLLSRAAARRRELAVRLAIGAGRARLVRQLLTETVMIFLLGAAGGLLLSRALSVLVISRLPNTGIPIHLLMGIDVRIVGFALGLSLVAAILCGIAPALEASKADVISTLKNEGQTTTQRSRLQNTFVVGQVAFSMVLVVAAGLFLSALKRVNSIPLGYDPHNVEVAMLGLGEVRKNRTGPVFFRELSERIRALPGVQESTIATFTPLEAGVVAIDLKPADKSAPPPAMPDPSKRVSSNSVAPGYFATLKIPLVAGRDFTPADRQDSQPVAIVSEKAARRLWPGENPIGRILPASIGTLGNNAVVVGVVRDVTVISGPETAGAIVYRPLTQQYFGNVAIIVRTAPGQRLAGEIRALLLAVNPNVTVLKYETLDEAVSSAMEPQRNAAAVTGSLGFVGLVLAAIGVYGVTAYAVARRTREIGIRIALGAERIRVVRLVLREGMSLMIVGIGIGLVLAYMTIRLIPNLPLDIPVADAVTFAGSAILFLMVGFIACWAPVHRATNIDAISALRQD